MNADPVKLEPASVDKLPVAFRHDWKTLPERRLHGSEFADGNARTERTCAHCGIVKITVHSGDGSSAWREWRLPNSTENWPVEHTPPCRGPKTPIDPTELVTRP